MPGSSGGSTKVSLSSGSDVVSAPGGSGGTFMNGETAGVGGSGNGAGGNGSGTTGTSKSGSAGSSYIFNDSSYYKTALTGEDNSALRVHAVLTKYLKCADPKDRAVYRQQMVTAYWELFRSVAPKMGDDFVPISKRMLLRFGVLLPSLFHVFG